MHNLGAVIACGLSSEKKKMEDIPEESDRRRTSSQLPLYIEPSIDNAMHRGLPNDDDSPHEFVAEATTLTSVTNAMRLLYLRHAMAQLSEMAWRFGVILILSQAVVASRSSLILVSTYGAFVTMASVVTSGRCGRAIDKGNDFNGIDDEDEDIDAKRGDNSRNVWLRRNRWQTVRRFIVAENLAVLAATGACLVLLRSTTPPTSSSATLVPLTNFTNTKENTYSSVWDGIPTDAWSIACLIAIHALGAIAQVLDQTILVAMERDWMVVICQTASQTLPSGRMTETGVYGSWAPVPTRNNEEEANGSIQSTEDKKVDDAVVFRQWLSRTNVKLKQITLGCEIAAPTIAGLVVPIFSHSLSDRDTETPNSVLDYRWACWAVGFVTAISLLVEYVCVARIYQLVPTLASHRNSDSKLTVKHSKQSLVPRSQPELPPIKECRNPKRRVSHRVGFWWLSQDLRVYFEQQSAMGGLGLAFLYANPMTFGNGIMMAYLLSRGMPLPLVGSLQGISSILGLLGTLAYHFSVKHQSVKETCLWGISSQSLCLGISFLSIVTVPNDAVSLLFLIGGVCASRIGLWVYDIGITQMQQEQVPSAIRGQVGGTQQSLNACFNLLSFGLGFIYPDPKDFVMYVFTGFASVTIAAYLYATGFRFQEEI